MRMRLMRFQYTISYIPGKDMTTADTLSRAPVGKALQSENTFCQELELATVLFREELPVTDPKLEEIRRNQEEEELLITVMKYVREGWPDKRNILPEHMPFFQERDSLTVVSNILMHGRRIYIPVSMRQEILQKIHAGHLGISKCRDRARESIWWPKWNQQLTTLITYCEACIKIRSNHQEPMLIAPQPCLPWQIVGMDMCELQGKSYLVIVDYYSRYPEVIQMASTTSSLVIEAIKGVFSRHGIPMKVISDNGPQFNSHLFTQFAQEFGFTHRTSSPGYPQSNGLAERAVQTVKNILKKGEKHLSLGLMAYRATPLRDLGNRSPAELLMNRQLRTTLPSYNLSC
jgi:hypothetical protein